MSSLEYQFEVDLRKGINRPYKITLKTERMSYETALNLAHELGRRGIHHTITEIDPKCNNRMRLTNKMLRMPRRAKFD